MATAAAVLPPATIVANLRFARERIITFAKISTYRPRAEARTHRRQPVISGTVPVKFHDFALPYRHQTEKIARVIADDPGGIPAN